MRRTIVSLLGRRAGRGRQRVLALLRRPQRVPTATRRTRDATLPLPIGAGTRPVAAVVERVLPAVVNVTTDVPTGRTATGQGVGTGFVVRADGVIVTNCHVVEGASKLTVFTLRRASPTSTTARVIGGDCENDLAILDDRRRRPADGAARRTPTSSSSASGSSRSATRSASRAARPSRPASSRRSTARSEAQDPNCARSAAGPGARRTPTSSRPTRRSTPATPAGRSWTCEGSVVGINSAGNDDAENIGFAIPIDAAKRTIEQADRRAARRRRATSASRPRDITADVRVPAGPARSSAAPTCSAYAGDGPAAAGRHRRRAT